jgi:3D (Asp-Asp-Asp) domain-containing protein
MRKISIVVFGLLFGITAFASNASAQESINTNTKTEFQLKDNIIILEGVIADATKAGAPYNYKGYKPVESERDQILAKWKAKRGNVNLPDEEFTINASAYTAAADECGKSDGITASGLKVKENRTLACPPMYPFGTRIKINGMGTYVCEDRGGAIKGNHFDIYMETKKEAFAFGRKNLSAQVVE